MSKIDAIGFPGNNQIKQMGSLSTNSNSKSQHTNNASLDIGSMLSGKDSSVSGASKDEDLKKKMTTPDQLGYMGPTLGQMLNGSKPQTQVSAFPA